MVQRSINSAVDSHELAGDQRSLLDLIDRLQFAQLDNVKLPQIVVVGDQSAGKSSVLEAISGTPFPRDAGACTRFATEIRLRRAAEASLSISIIPDRSRNFADQEKLRAFGGRVDATMAFETLMRYAVDLIAPKGIPGRFAAKDILVVEKRGPDMPLLTLVDLPGLVRNANNDQSIEDIRTIEALSDRYMKSRRTIILAVVGGNTDYVQAPILTKARQFDPKGTRTIGVLTKPDLTKDIGLEDKFIELVRNQDKENHFALGWFVLLNPGPRQNGEAWPTQEEQRQREADFFSRGKWAILPPHMCGAAALKQKLSVQLQRHIGRYVKVLRRQIQDALDKTEAELKGLGEGKDTPEEMRVELVELFSSSKELVIPAVYGFYKNPPKKNFFRVVADPNGTPAQNLRARAIEENDRFAERVRANGRKMTFHGASGGRRDSLVQGTFESKQEFARREVESLLRQIRGTEFPMDPKPRAVYMLFQSYSENWPQLAQEHKENLAIVCNEFLSEVIDYVWPERMRYPIMMHFLDLQMQQLLNKAQVELERLTQDMNLEVQPYDPEYEEKLRRWHGEMTAEGGTYSEPQEVLEKMLIYYELSAKSFIRNVITQVVERHLLQGIYGIFDSVEILKMSNETIEAIAAENRETRDRRMTLKQQKTAIEEARSICASLAMRKELRSSIDEDLEETSDEEDGTSGPRQQQQQQQRRSQPQDPRQPLTHNPSVSSMHQQQQSAPQQQQQTARQAAPPQRSPRQQRTADASQYNPYASAASPVAETPSRSSGETTNDYYATSSQAPTSVPPPPPRPEKVSYEASAPAAAAQPRASQPYAHSFGGEREGLGFDAQQAEYAAAQKKRSARGLFNRG